MNIATLTKGLDTKILGRKIIYFDQTDSTNTQAKQRAEAELLPEGTVFITPKQTQGRGSDGNEWEGGQGHLSFSIVFKEDATISTLFPLYPAVSLCRVLKRHYGVPAHVKWPNDVLVGKQKIAGILCEGAAGKYMIVGIGLNVNESNFPPQLCSIATSMKLVKQQNYMLEDVFQTLLKEYEYLLYQDVDIRKAWLDNTQMLNKEISVSIKEKKQTLTVTGMSEEGFLQVRHQDGRRENLMARQGLDISPAY